jgi:transglutaminase-like putative cysteine protease
VLFLNVALGSPQPEADLLPVLPVLTVFSALAMMLLMRLQLSQQRQQWARRHIADSGEVSRLFLRTGVLFVAMTVISATSLTVWASVDAQDVDLGDLDGPMQDFGSELSRWLGLVGVPPPDADTTTIEGSWDVQDHWEQPKGVAFRAQTEGQLRGNYWWGYAHDRFDGQGWDRIRIDSIEVDADEPLPVLQETTAGGPHVVKARITIGRSALARGMLFRPADAAVVDQDLTAYFVDEGGGIGDVEFGSTLERGDVVVVDAWVRDYRAGATSLSANQLRAAGEDYPPWVEIYLQGGDEAAIAGELALAEAAEIEALHENAYDRAVEVQKRLRVLDYTPDMAGVCDSDEPIPECVLREERGFCQHYSTTMAMVLRAMDIPTRLVTGYLPGDRRNGEWVVEQAAFHNWVEAWFPGHGWVRFDPTPPRRFGQAATVLPNGDEVPLDPDGSGPPPSSETLAPLETAVPVPDEGAAVLPTDGGDSPISALLTAGALAIVLTVLVGLLLFFRLRRLPAGDGGLAYRGIVDMATRLGYGPHPSQTEYEYADALSETLPQIREDLHLVAEVRVETAYGQRQVDADRQGALRRAYARIRTTLMRLSLRPRR